MLSEKFKRKRRTKSVTEHAKDRIKERCGVCKRSSERLAHIAYDKGIKHSETSGSVKRWVDSLWFRNKQANNIRLYGDKTYIFCNSSLVTVIQTPKHLQNAVNSLMKRKKMKEEDV